MNTETEKRLDAIEEKIGNLSAQLSQVDGEVERLGAIIDAGTEDDYDACQTLSALAEREHELERLRGELRKARETIEALTKSRLAE